MAKKSEEKRARILDAALDVFEKEGFAAAKMETVAKRAGVAKGTLYNYFKGKEALLFALAEGFAQEMLKRLAALPMSRATPIKARILELVDPIIGESEDAMRSRRILRLVWAEGLRNPSITAPIFKIFIRHAFDPDGELSKSLAEEKVPDLVRRYPIALGAPIVQGILLANIAGGAVALDLKAYYEAYLDMLFSQEKGLEEAASSQSGCASDSGVETA